MTNPPAPAPQPPAPASRKLTRWNEDTVAGLAILLLCAAAFALTFRFDTVPAILSQNIPPTFFPRLVLGTMGILSGALLLRGLRTNLPKKEPVPPVVLFTAGIVTAGVLMLRPLGVLVLSFLVSLFLPLLWGERRLRLVLLLAALTPVMLYVIFGWLLQLQLPMGILERIL